MATLCQQCKPEPTGQLNLAQCRTCKQLYRIDNGKRCDGYGNALEEEEKPISITCPYCWQPVSLTEARIAEIEREQRVELPCACRVPVGGREGVLERARKAKENTYVK